jgi:outer membrane lipoprotein LolB
MVLLSGCAVVPPPGEPGLAFAAGGKFGIKDADSGYSAQFSWRHYQHGYDIEVWGPLGQGRTHLRGDESLMQVRRGDDILAQGEPEHVMQTHLGWSVPIRVLPAWIQGFPSTQLPHSGAKLDDQGRYTAFAQAGWQVNLERYTARGDVLPELFTPARIVALNGVRKVTVVVRNYAQ